MTDAAQPAPPATQRPFASPRIVPFLLALTYLVYWQVAPRLSAESFGAIIGSSLICLVLVIWFAASVARAMARPVQALVWTCVLALVAIPLRAMLAWGNPAAVGLHQYVPGLMDLVLAAFAASLGAWLSFLVRGANMIPPVAAVLALVDVWTVLLNGPVQRIMNSQSPVAHAVTQAMTVTVSPPARGATSFPLIVGFADFLFIAFFVAAICRFVPSPRTYTRTVRALAVVLVLYMLVVALFTLSLPALVPMAVLMIALHWRQFHYERSELFALLYAALFIALIAAGFWFLSHRAPPTGSAAASVMAE